MLQILRKPFCTIVLFCSAHLDNLLFRTALYILYIDEANVIRLYERGSLGSDWDGFGIGFIILLLQTDGTDPESKHTLNRTWRIETEVPCCVFHQFQQLCPFNRPPKSRSHLSKTSCLSHDMVPSFKTTSKGILLFLACLIPVLPIRFQKSVWFLSTSLIITSNTYIFVG